MSRSNYSPSAGSTIVEKLKAYEGGTGSTNPAAARAALGLIPSTTVDQPGGVAKLDGEGKLPLSYFGDDGPSPVSVTGLSSVPVKTNNAYIISNFDIFSTYTLEVIGEGSVSRSGNTIVYSAPSNPGAGGFKINGRSINITTTAIGPVKPTITATDVFGGTGRAAIISSGSTFALNSGTGIHQDSDWQIAYDAGFVNLAYNVVKDNVNKTYWKSGDLGLSTTYYVRVRYRDMTGNVSDWSDSLTVVVKASYTISLEEAKFSPADLTQNNWFGLTVSMSGDGKRLYAGASLQSQASGGSGAAYVFVRDGVSWSLEKKFDKASSSGVVNYACAGSLDETGSRLIIGSYSNTGGGTAYIYVRNGSTWIEEATLLAPSPVGGDGFGCTVTISADSTRAIIGARAMSSGAGAAFIFVRNGSAWSMEQKLTSSDTAAGDWFGAYVSIDGNGTRAAVSSYLKNSSTGGVYIFLRTGVTWNQETKILPADSTVDDEFGRWVSLSKAGDRFISGSPKKNSSTGAAYIFARTANSWTQEVKIEITGGPNAVSFGYYNSISYAGDRVSISETKGSGPEGVVQPGAVYVYGRSGSIWSLEKKINASDASSNGNFSMGNFLCGYGDRLAVGAYSQSKGALAAAGAAYVYR